DADDRYIARRLHEVGAVDDVVPEVAELAEIAVHPRDDRRGIRIDVEIVLVDPGWRRVRHAPAEWLGDAERPHPDTRKRVPAFVQGVVLQLPLGPEDTDMGTARKVEAGVKDGRGSE